MPPVRVRRAGTKAVFVRKGAQKRTKPDQSTGSQNPDGASLAHNAPNLPSQLLPVLRKPLEAYHRSTSCKFRRRVRVRETSFLVALQKRIEADAQRWLSKSVHPIAVLAWLAADEPINAELLLDNAASFGDDGQEVDPIFAAELDNVLRRFGASQITDGPSSQENPLIEIPKDFSLVTTPSATEGVDVDVMMAEYSSEDDRQPFDKLEKSVGKKKKGATDIGFDPVQILKKHAIQFQKEDCPKVSDLDCDIHPLFWVENFHGCPEHIYEILKPALRLSTLLLTHKATSSFWHTLVFGMRQRSTKSGLKCTRIADVVAWTKENASLFEARLKRLSDSLHFHFSLWPSERNKGVWTYGSMHAIRDYKSGYLPKTGELCRRSRICLHTDFYITAKRLSLLAHPDPAMVLRFHFFFAVNLCHEMAHFLEISSHQMEFVETWLGPEFAHASNAGEAFMFDYPWNEMGQAFETRVFGGIIKPISCRMDCAHGLTTYSEPGLDPRTGRLSAVRTFLHRAYGLRCRDPAAGYVGQGSERGRAGSANSVRDAARRSSSGACALLRPYSLEGPGGGAGTGRRRCGEGADTV